MKAIRTIVIFLFVVCIATSLNAQTTGLVLSGGGAKGMAHIGVIKALEDNNIRIDYIAGTSIGAIVGSLYAMGYTTDEMLELFNSEDFGRWKTGVIEAKYRFSYKKQEADASVLSVPLIREEDGTVAKFRTHLVPSQVMDFAFLELTSAANAACGRDYDKLMVPFRCVAADIYEKKAVVFREGNLAHTVRASMNYPLYFEPISIDSSLLFDGGIYNNFPFDVLIDDFNPDFIIGSKVSEKSKKPQKDDLMAQIQNMIMQPTNFVIPDSIGVVIDTKTQNIGLLDFEMADSLFDLGYKNALKMIPEIRKRAAYMSNEDLDEKRKSFKQLMPELKFSDIIISGVNPLQEDYIRNLLKKEEEEFDLDQLKEEYYRLVSEENITNAYPEAVYNNNKERFDLLLNIDLKGSYNLKAGGLLSFTGYNQAYLGFDYYALSDVFNQFSANMFLGRYYSSFKIAHRITMPGKNKLLIDLALTGNRWNYFSSDVTTLFEPINPSYILKRETTFEATIGSPLSNNSTLQGGLSFNWLNDDYYQDRNFEEGQIPDNSQYLIGAIKLGLKSNNLNRKQYATKGNRFDSGLSLNTGFEYFENGEIDSLITMENQGKQHTWLAARFRNENYSGLGKKLIVGSLLDITVSNRSYSSNYTSTLINSYRFAPTEFSRQIFAKSLRTNSYIALGIKPIYKLSENFSLRSGIYLFAPFYPITEDEGEIVREDLFARQSLIGELGFVYHTPVGPISAGINYYSHERRKTYFFINFGYILFNQSGLN